MKPYMLGFMRKNNGLRSFGSFFPATKPNGGFAKVEALERIAFLIASPFTNGRILATNAKFLAIGRAIS